MDKKTEVQGTITILRAENYLAKVIESFLVDRKIQNMAPGTMHFYRSKLQLFQTFCDGQQIKEIPQIDATSLRDFLLWLDQTGHNPGGQHGAYRAVRTLLRWWQAETEPFDWKDPTKKVKAPRLGQDPLDPVPIETVSSLLETCQNTPYGLRDRAILFFLIDTGVRAAELLAITLDDIDLGSGSVLIKRGKGRKTRTVFIGSKCKRILRRYLISRSDDHPELWISRQGGQLSYSALVKMIHRRAQIAGVKAPEVHSFRRAFALAMLRNGCDIYTLQKLMGHADLQVLRRYLAQTGQDLQAAHNRASPGDKL